MHYYQCTKPSWHEFLISLMNADDLLIPFQRNGISPLCRHVQCLLEHSRVWLLSHHTYITVQRRGVPCVMCQVSDVFRQLKFAFHIPSGHTWVSYFQLPELISWALGHICHMTLKRNISPLCTVQQRVRCKFDANDSLGSLGNQVLRAQ